MRQADVPSPVPGGGPATSFASASASAGGAASGEDSLRARLGRLGGLLPATNQELPAKAFWEIARRLSITRSLYYSARFHGRFLIGRGTKIVTQRTSRVEFSPDGWLLVGLHHHGPNRALINLGRDARIVVKGTSQIWRGAQVTVIRGGRLELGGKNIFNEDSRLICCKSISFGVSSGMSWNATVVDTDLHPITVDGRMLEQDRSVRLGDRAFVGAGATVLKGVTLGDGAIVGAGAIVTKDVPARCIVAGNPARVVHENIDWV